MENVNDEWAKSPARDKLYEMLCAGLIPADMKPKEVYLTYLKHLPEFAPFQDYTALKFSGKIGPARKRATRKSDRAAEDLSYYEHDRAIFPAPLTDTKGYPMWQKSTAQEKLRKALREVEGGKREYKKPRFLYLEEPEWQEYPLEIFRKRIYQELKFERRAAWLLEKYSLDGDGDGTPSDHAA